VLLAELDATLRQFPTIRRTLYAPNGDVPAFYAWLQLGPPWMPTGTWRAIAPAPIAGRDGAAAVWTGRQLLVWDAPSAGGRTTGALYDPVRDRWTPIARGPALAANRSGPVWTGTQLVAWNGTGTGGIAYAPATDSWSTLPPGPLVRGDRTGAAVVWTGREVVIWSG
jgi:hypothetical protein